MIHLALALLSSFAVALILRWVESRNESRLGVIASNYISASLLALWLQSGGGGILPPVVLGAGILMGALFLAGFLVFGLAMRTSGIAAAVTMGRVSLVIPVGVAVAFFGEAPRRTDLAALLLVLAVLWAWEGGGRRLAPELLLLFLLFGTISAGMKWFAVTWPDVGESGFLAVVFAAALALGWWRFRAGSGRISWRGLGIGLLLGVPNFYSAYFLVRALEVLPAYVVFPVVDTGVILLSGLAGALFFAERPGPRRVVCMVLAALALILLGFARNGV